MTGYAFQTRARTIDHLGRGQIADSPTAVSELWKNAYDAYARKASLAVYRSADAVVAAIFDDGIGMDLDTIRSKWMVLGTESKAGASEDETEEEHAFRSARKLDRRIKQGEKGIGRLSVAFLAPATLLIAKKAGHPFAVAAIDWRLFENPYLSLSAISIPVVTCESTDEIAELYPLLAEDVVRNLDPSDRDGRDAWARFASAEAEAGKSRTDEAIRHTWLRDFSLKTVLDHWDVATGESESGTVLIMSDVQNDLAALLDTERSDGISNAVRNRFRRTLTAFTDPMTDLGESVSFDPNFSYAVDLYKKGPEGSSEPLVGPDQVFGTERFIGLEHQVYGSFDGSGVFRGRVVAFGKDRGPVEIFPAQVLKRADRNTIGPFQLAIGGYEADRKRSSLTDGLWEAINAAADEYSGVTVYRDGLRVLPYGRPDSDFFELEERRSKNTGRAFWSHRKTFGRVAFTRTENPNLRDKAGREGLVDNRARNLMKELVVGVLIDTANRYFGSASDIREVEVAANQKAFEQRQKAAAKLKARGRVRLNTFLVSNTDRLHDEVRRSTSMVDEMERAYGDGDRQEALRLVASYHQTPVDRETLRPPAISTPPQSVENAYRDYKDSYRELLAALQRADSVVARITTKLGDVSDDVVTEAFSRNEAIISALVGRLHRAIERRTAEFARFWSEKAASDTKLYRKETHDIVEDGAEGDHGKRLNLLQVRRYELEERFSAEYGAAEDALTELKDGIDLDGAAATLAENASALEQRLQDVLAVAQAGISIEIIGHELEVLDSEVRRNLRRLPDQVRESSAYRNAFEAHAGLTDRIRFLSPMRIAGYRNRETITGSEISLYMREFFERVLVSERIDLVFDESFDRIRIRDIRSRIYPCFINIINNAIYWVSRSEERQILVSAIEDTVIISDSGPGVHEDDVERLFSLYFSRRTSGRGVGLYLTRANLAVAGHTIRYAGPTDPRPLPGATFLIEFKGLRHDV